MKDFLASPFATIENAVKSGNIPGAVLGAVNKDGFRIVKYCGFAQLKSNFSAVERPIKRETVFDLASVTKTIFTTTAIMKLVATGKIALEDPLSKHIPDLRQYDINARERGLTIGQCLSHSTFLPAVAPIYTHGLDPTTTRAFILQREWIPGPSVYSDINFILLGIVLERVLGIPLLEQETPNGTSFRPNPTDCVATEYCTWRDRLICGEVHDENAYSMGGASGHAGLFGTMDNVLDFTLDLMNDKLLPSEYTKQLFERTTPERTLGWEIKYPKWPGGQACSQNTIGHTGFTGTGVWIDKERGLAWSLLTNRVHPSRHKESGIIPLRRQVSEEIIASFDALSNS